MTGVQAMATIYLIRHCESEGNACRRAQAQTDALVTRKGYGQIEALRQHFADKRIDAVYSSDTYRAVQTVEPIAKDRGLPVRVRFLLREITTGIWEDMAWGNIDQDYPEAHRVWLERPWDLITPGANSFQELSERVIFALRRIAKDIGPDGVAAVASHSCSIKAALCGIYGWPFERVLECGHGDNCSYSRLEVDADGNITVAYAHESSFLPKHLTRAWSGVAGSDINLAVNPCDLATQSGILLELAKADAGERGEEFEPVRYLEEAKVLLAKNPLAIALAFLKGKPVGYVRMGYDSRLPADCGLVERMYVLPHMQGVGYGDQLLGYASHEMRYADLRRLAVPTVCSTEEQRIVDRFIFNEMDGLPQYRCMTLFCPPLEYPVLP